MPIPTGLPNQNRFILFLLLFMSVCVVTLPAQQMPAGLNSTDLSTVRAADLTDQQLRGFLTQAQAQGVTVDQALQLAITRGLRASEAQQIRSRLAGLRDEVAIYEARDFRGRYSQNGFMMSDSLLADTISVDSLRKVAVFGAELFRRRQVDFTPSMNIPTPKNYQLGADDELVVTIWGDRTDQLNLTVSPEGTVTLQNRGPVYVNGLTIEEARTRLLGQLSQLYGGLRPASGEPTTYAEISLGRVRTITVTVTGEVRVPGTYSISSLSTVFNALYSAGGPNDIGSYRTIRVVRENQVVTEFDLYDFLLRGDQTHNIRLRDQDVIQISPYASRVTIDGLILRPALYELRLTNTLKELLDMSGGFAQGAYTRQVRIYRYTETQRRIVTVPQELYHDVTMVNGDSIHIEKVMDRFENLVNITGAVWREGDYELKDGMTLSQLIAEADGLRPDAFKSRGMINRIRADMSLEQLSFDVEQVVMNPDRHDILLQREDEVIIQGMQDLRDEAVVEIQGSVREEGIFVWYENMTLQDLILKANGFTDYAEMSRVEVSRRSKDFIETGKLVDTYRFDLDKDLKLHEDHTTFVLQPYDYVHVFRRPDFQVQQYITLEGEVVFPGRYAITSRNERISDVIARAGGLTQEAFIDGARITRQRTVIDRAQVDYNFLENDTAGLVNVRADSTTRIGINLQAALRNPASRENIYVREGDVLRIPKVTQTVRVSGGVMQDVEVRYVPGASQNYYINHAGGLNTRAYKRRSYVIYANGEIDRTRRILGLAYNKPDIKPGAEIVIPVKPESQRMTTQEIVSVSSMVVSMTTTLLIAIQQFNR